MENTKINVIVEKTSTGYSAYAENYSAFTTGETLEEIKSNMVEALNLFFEDEGRVIEENELELIQ